MLIIGWHCVGADLTVDQPPAYGQITCHKGGNVVEVQYVPPHLAPVP